MNYFQVNEKTNRVTIYNLFILYYNLITEQKNKNKGGR